MTAQAIQQTYMPHRTVKAIQSKIGNLGLNGKTQSGHRNKGKQHRQTTWTEKELQLLHENYNKMGDKALSEKILTNKTPDQIHNRARTENLRRYTREPWTDPENQILIENAATHTCGELSDLIPNRSRNAIYIQLGRLNLTPKPDKKGRKPKR